MFTPYPYSLVYSLLARETWTDADASDRKKLWMILDFMAVEQLIEKIEVIVWDGH